MHDENNMSFIDVLIKNTLILFSSGLVRKSWFFVYNVPNIFLQLYRTFLFVYHNAAEFEMILNAAGLIAGIKYGSFSISPVR